MSVLKSVLTLMGANYSAKDYKSEFTNGESAVALYKRQDLHGTSYALQSSLTSKGNADESPRFTPEVFDIQEHNLHMDRLDHFVPPVVQTAINNSIFNRKSRIEKQRPDNQIITTIPIGLETSDEVAARQTTINDSIAGPRSILQFRMTDRALSSVNAGHRIALAQYVANALEPVLDTQPEFTRREVVRDARNNLDTIEGATSFLEGLNERWKAAILDYSPETTLHVGRVTEVTTMIAKGINEAQSDPMEAITIDPQQLKLLELSAGLHDFGKLYTPKRILDSGIPVPGSRHELGGYDRELMERHAQDVYDVLDIPGIEIIGKVRDIAGAHHLHANGKGGYPKAVLEKLNAKKGVPFEAKVLMVADVFEALTAEREYRGGNGLPLSTTLNIMFNDAKKGMIDAQIFRFAIESGIFDAYAQKYSPENNKHLKPYDSELLEKLAYSDEHLAAAQKLKEEFCAENGISMQGLDSFLRMPFDAAEKKMYELEGKAPEDIDKRDVGFPKPELLDHILALRAKLNKDLNPEDAPKHVIDGEFPHRKISASTTAYKGAFVMKADKVYINKLLAMTAKDIEVLNVTKNEIIKEVLDKDGDDPEAKRILEDMVKWHIFQKSGLSTGIISDGSQNGWEANKDKITDALTEIEADNLAATKKRILDAIPVAPLSDSENLTLFSPRRHIKKTPAEAAVGV